MKFIKENSYDIIRLYINQLGITIFSLVLYFSVASIEAESTRELIKAGVSLFATLFYFALIYTAAWDYGAKDRIRVDGGRMKEQKWKGIVMGVLANVLNFFFIGICLISYAFTDVAFFAQSFDICNLLMRFTEAMYLGTVQFIFRSNMLLQTVGFLIFSLISIFVIHLGYTLGMKEKRIFSSKPGGNNTKR